MHSEHSHSHNHSHSHHHEAEPESEEEGDRRHFNDVVAAYRDYHASSVLSLERLRRDYAALSVTHREVLKSYPNKLAAMRQAVDANAAFIKELLQSVDLFGGRGADDGGGVASADSLDKVHSTLRQFVRDWADGGELERQRCYAPIIAEVEQRFPIDLSAPENINKYRILVPGCGLGRLVWEFALRGYATQGNEFSYHMLLASNWVLNRSNGIHTAAVYPYALTNANRVKIANQFERFLVPNVDTRGLPDGVDLSMNAGEFCEVYGQEDFESSFDVIASPFFLDTAHNPLDYLDTIWYALKPGGVWINLGPLLWHYTDQPDEAQIELSLGELYDVVKAMGFLLDIRNPIITGYCGDRSSMMQTVYHCTYFIATKPKLTEGGADKSSEARN